MVVAGVRSQTTVSTCNESRFYLLLINLCCCEKLNGEFFFLFIDLSGTQVTFQQAIDLLLEPRPSCPLGSDTVRPPIWYQSIKRLHNQLRSQEHMSYNVIMQWRKRLTWRVIVLPLPIEEEPCAQENTDKQDQARCASRGHS